MADKESAGGGVVLGRIKGNAFFEEEEGVKNGEEVLVCVFAQKMKVVVAVAAALIKGSPVLYSSSSEVTSVNYGG